MTTATAAVILAAIALQTYWISRSIGRVERAVEDVDGRLEAFRAENHRDMQAHTEAITDLRERVARLEGERGASAGE